jgi:hypothetical protein
MFEVTKDEAILLLKKWRDEKTLLQAGLSFDRTRCIVLGRLGRVDDDEAQIDGLSQDQLPAQYGLIIRFANIKRFCFGDMNHLPQPRPTEIQQAIDAFETHLLLDLHLGACMCAIYAIRDSGVDR